MTIDIDARLREVEANATQRLTDTTVWTDLDTFLGRGGKVLFYHGVSDPWFSAFDSWDYWQRAAATNGAMFTEASRYYMNPGMMHCAGGNAYDRFAGRVGRARPGSRTPDSEPRRRQRIDAALPASILSALHRRRSGEARKLRVPDAERELIA